MITGVYVGDFRHFQNHEPPLSAASIDREERTHMASYENRISVRIPHHIRMGLGILADDMGISISYYVRGILENYASGEDVKQPIPSAMGRTPSADTWHRVAVAMYQRGDDAHIHIRVTDTILAALDDGATYNRSTLIRSIILSHIYRNVPRLSAEIIRDLAGRLENVTKQCKNEARRLIDGPPIR